MDELEDWDDDLEPLPRESLPEPEWPAGVKRGDRVRLSGLPGMPDREGILIDVTRNTEDPSSGFYFEIESAP